jgi:stage V sporulation protein AE
MELVIGLLKAFAAGGLICVVAQILIDKTKMTPGRILVMFVVIGCLLGGVGLYERFAEFAGAGATVPLPGFGYALAKGVMREVDQAGLIGIFTGGIKAAAAGIAAAMVFALLSAFVFSPKAKG